MCDLPFSQVVCGDCVKVLKAFPEESIDCVVTDPPYGIAFMGKQWDQALPPKQAFVEMFRVLKSGALAFVMSSPRQDVLWRMMQMLEDVGFELQQSFVSWIYKTGFPKAYDVSKGIDKKLGKKRKIVGKYQYPTDQPKKRQLHGGGKPKNTYGKYEGFEGDPNITEPSSNLAKKWQGWKSITGLKPALECILMVNKPFSEKTIVDNVLAHGIGAINVDACRIPFQNHNDVLVTEHKNAHARFGSGARENRIYGQDARLRSEQGDYSAKQGRFPANLIVSDKALDNGKITGAGITGSGVVRQEKRGEYLPHNVYGDRKVIHKDVPYLDVGDQSRYFDLDAWAKHRGFLDVPKPSKSERDKGLENIEGKKKYYTVYSRPRSLECFGSDKREGKENFGKQLRKNIHPTVKPIKLMAYLIELGCPAGGVVLDPFVGSGTTCIAAKQLGRKWIGIEQNPEYAQIAQQRIGSISLLTDFME